MNKFKALRIANPILIVSFLFQGFTGVIFAAEITLPQMEFFGKIHKYNGLLMTAMIVLHVALNWGWIKANIFKM